MIRIRLSAPLLVIATAAALVSNVGFADRGDPREISSPVDKIFVPDGFDDNDNTQIVLHGEYPNTCFRTGHTSAKVDKETKTIYVTATSLRYSMGCATVMTPFIQVVRVGILEKGEWTVEYGADQTVSQKFRVKESTTNSADEFLYAPVKNAYISVDQDTGAQTLHLRGTYPHIFANCVVMKRIVVKTGPEDVVVVRPIMETDADPAECGPVYSHKYHETKRMPEPFYGKGLLHVRVLNGNSLNTLIGIRR